MLIPPHERSNEQTLRAFDLDGSALVRLQVPETDRRSFDRVGAIGQQGEAAAFMGAKG